jgi:hypothetical protein
LKELEAIAQNYGTSRPIFKLNLSQVSARIEVNTTQPIYKYNQTPAKDAPILEALVWKFYNETFNIDKNSFQINHYKIAKDAMWYIKRSIPAFLEKHLDTRSPKQAQLYRWANRGMPTTSEFDDILVILYKYMRSFCDEDMNLISDSKHINNTIALLTAMEEKYSGE